MKISKALTAIATKFARDCYSEIELDEDYGRKWMPAQVQFSPDVFGTGEFWEKPNLQAYTIIQLGMIADSQKKADADWWAIDEMKAKQAKDAREELVLQTIEMGAGDRETAERWLSETEDDNLQWLQIG